ncbi:MAG TPA: nicotinamide-nucleotide amidohydrolase family protein [Magnetospirillaceae bacterium]|nr:nicotinamide-nucleotide amidohydrolase family protein [Magnetospirillaceae bacterium]
MSETADDAEAGARRLLGALELAGWTAALAESCTGGLISAALTSVPGASRSFWGAVVSYAYEAKEKVLSVPRGVLERYGAVSAETVRAMALGVLNLSGADVSAAVSGISGPQGEAPGKPVGTVWIGLASRDGRTRELRLALHGSRKSIRTESTLRVLDELRVFVEERLQQSP